jgi:eukaryotic-like serine/threonine-protein kinase
MTTKLSTPEPEPSNLQTAVDPLADTRMAPAEPIHRPARLPTDSSSEPSKTLPAQDGSLIETCNLPANHGTLPLQTPSGDSKTRLEPVAQPASLPGAPPGPPPLNLDQTATSPTLPTQLAPPSAGQSEASHSETIAHASQAPDCEEAFKPTRVLPNSQRDAPARIVTPTGRDQSDVPLTLVVDSTKQPPVSHGTHDTPFIQSPSSESFRPSPGVPQHVGDYEILSVLGRGGMGVVYKARQKRLNRIVALKMILGGLHASDEDLRRFRQEAEASARLQHPNIVQIHEIGDVDGKPYFSLEYADAGSLAGKMANEPQPAFAAAQLIEILARAMHYAHQRGVVHRDLKPANILLTTPAPDGSSMAPASTFGIPKVTDFGLAKRMDVDLGQTQTGAILGTPSYMAPEQAGGRIREIGPCTDIYALGAILYDLLTGRPPFKANTLADTLRQVQMTEPVSPGRLQPQVPRDLATICLKCLNKEPKKRYESSLALAEDLGRFLSGEPIHARPTSLIERAIKWSIRRPALAAMIAVSVLSFVALGIGGWYSAWSLFNANQRIRAANELAEAERSRAEDNLEQALEAIDGVLTQVSVDLTEVPLMEKPRAKLLKKALALFEHLPREDQKTAKARFQSARANERLGEVQGLFDKLPESEQAYKEAETRLKELLADAPKQPEYRTELARTYHNEGLLFRKRGLIKDAQECFEQAVAQRESLAREFPDNTSIARDLAQSTYWLGTTLARVKGGQKKAEEDYRAAIDMQKKLLTMKFDEADSKDQLRDIERDQARMLNNLGMMLGQTGRRKSAIDTLTSAANIQARLASQNPDIPTIRREQARSLHNLAIQQWLTEGMKTSSEATFEKAIELLTTLVREFPSVPAYRDELAGVYRTQGILLQDNAKPVEAEKALRRAMEIHQALVAQFPGIPDYQSKLADDLQSLGALHQVDQGSLQFERFYQQALALQSWLIEQYPENADYRLFRAQTLKGLSTRINKYKDPASPSIFGTRKLTALASIGSIFSFAGQATSSLAGADLGLGCALLCNSQLMAEHIRVRTLRQVAELDRSAVQELRKALELEPRRIESKNDLLEALRELGKAELAIHSYQGLARVASELAALDPGEVEIRLQAAEFYVRAIMHLHVDTQLSVNAAAELDKEYAAEALDNLKAASRLDPKYALSRLPVEELYWKKILERPEFKAALNELNERAKPVID